MLPSASCDGVRENRIFFCSCWAAGTGTEWISLLEYYPIVISPWEKTTSHDGITTQPSPDLAWVWLTTEPRMRLKWDCETHVWHGQAQIFSNSSTRVFRSCYSDPRAPRTNSARKAVMFSGAATVGQLPDELRMEKSLCQRN